MNVMLFHLMPYADLDLEASKDFPTVWATLPNRFYDPQKGHALYNRYLDELEYGERLGFDPTGRQRYRETGQRATVCIARRYSTGGIHVR